MGFTGIGALVGSLVIASMPSRNRGKLLLYSALLLGISLVAFAWSTNYVLSIGIMLFVGLGQQGRMALTTTMLQWYVEDEYRGRVMSLYMMEFGLMSLGVFFMGLLAEVIGPEYAIGGAAVVLGDARDRHADVPAFPPQPRLDRSPSAIWRPPRPPSMGRRAHPRDLQRPPWGRGAEPQRVGWAFVRSGFPGSETTTGSALDARAARCHPPVVSKETAGGATGLRGGCAANPWNLITFVRAKELRFRTFLD